MLKCILFQMVFFFFFQEYENLLKKVWIKWRVEFARTTPLQKIDNFETKHLVSQVSLLYNKNIDL